MWTCQVCGESHEDQFDSCWKCAGEEASALTSPPAPARTRGLGWLLLPTLFGLVVGLPVVLALSFLPGAASFVVGLAITVVVVGGAVLWAFVPYLGESGANAERQSVPPESKGNE
jgi:hypothetical protein